MANDRRPESATQAGRFTDEENRWRAVLERDPAAEGCFVYSVRTTGIYCRPSCPARRPLRRNVRFHDTWELAQREGFRPCQRCRPGETSLAEHHREIVARACRLLETGPESPSLDDLAVAAGLSRFHFHRIFKRITGMTPQHYRTAIRAQRLRQELGRSETVTEALYAAGYSSSGHFYANATPALGMTPAAYHRKGAGETIRFAVGESTLGSVLVAATEQGVCAILLGDDPDLLARHLQDRFPRAKFVAAGGEFEIWVANVVGMVEQPTRALDLPLDIRGTAFQMHVWDALRQIPCGQTISYTELAERIGQPQARRAVAAACGANPIAVAIPCHRVVRRDASLCGYRWGVERKAELLRRERDAT